LSERTDNLYKNGAVSKDAFDQVQLKKSTTESEYLQAKSQYAAARTDYNYKSDLLNNSAIYAQQDGYIAQKICNENERVGAYTPVIIVRSGSQIVNIGIPQQELAQIKLGFSAEVIVDEETAQELLPVYLNFLIRLPIPTKPKYLFLIKLSD
jgi:multidrug resistance efflux pump